MMCPPRVRRPAFWPAALKGQQTYHFRDERLILGHDGNKLWFYLERKDNLPAKHAKEEAGAGMLPARSAGED